VDVLGYHAYITGHESSLRGVGRPDLPRCSAHQNVVPVVMRPVQSSSIAAAGYDSGRRTLRIRFIGGDAYDYLRVPPQVFRHFLEAPSKGQFVNWKIKPFFSYRRVN
jgi:hypothetical protein